MKIKVDGKEVKAWKSNLLKKTVVYLQDDKTKEKNYYIYNTDTNTVETMLRLSLIHICTGCLAVCRKRISESGKAVSCVSGV